MLSPVSLSPAIIVHRYRWYRRKIYHWCHCHQQSLFTSVVDTGNKFIASAVVTGENCSPVSLIPAKNLSSVSLSPAIIFQRCQNPWQRLIAGVNNTADKFVSDVIDTAEQFIAGVVDTADKHSFAIISANFRKKSMILMEYSGARGDTESWKITEVKSRVRLPLSVIWCIRFLALTFCDFNIMWS